MSKTATKAKAETTDKPPAKFVPPPPRPDETIPDLDRTLDVLGAHVVADAIDAYLRAKHRHQVIFDRSGANADSSIWDSMAEELRDTAQKDVLKLIVAWYYPGRDHYDIVTAATRRWPAIGIAYRGVIYAVVPTGTAEGRPIGYQDPGKKQHMARLEEIEMSPGVAVHPDLAEMTDLDAFFGWNKPPIPVPTRTPAEDTASLFGDRIEIPDDVRLNAPPKDKGKKGESKPRGKRSPRTSRA